MDFNQDFPPIMVPPGSEMSIKRIPLPDDILRLECLKQAARIASGAAQTSPVHSSAVIAMAEEFVDYVKGKEDSPDAGSR